MLINKLDNSFIIKVECNGRIVNVRIALNSQRQARVILGKCAVKGREKYYVWAKCATLSTKPHLTCRITGWQADGTHINPPQGTSVAIGDIQLDSCFDGFRTSEDVTHLVDKALQTYEFTSMYSPQPASPRKTLDLARIAETPRAQSSHLQMITEMEDLRRRVSDLEESGRERTAALMMSREAYPSGGQHHFLSTVLCKSED